MWNSQLSLPAFLLVSAGQQWAALPPPAQHLFAGIWLGPAVTWCSLSNHLVSRCLRLDICSAALCLSLCCIFNFFILFLVPLIEKNVRTNIKQCLRNSMVVLLHWYFNAQFYVSIRILDHVQKTFCFGFGSAILGKSSLRLVGVHLSREWIPLKSGLW